MPEQLTKHPEVTLQVLQSAGAQCGIGAPQTILTQCPAERFCALPGGEICVYGLADATRMTQLTPGDWQALVHSVAASVGGVGPGPPAAANPGLAVAYGLGLMLLGVAVGWMLRRAR